MLLNGKIAAQSLQKKLKATLDLRLEKGLRAPHLVAILLGNDGASATYVQAKMKACQEIGFKSTVLHLPENTSQAELLAHIHALNADAQTDGILVQLPLPKHIAEKQVILAIDPKKDVDGFHPENLGRAVIHLPTFLPATPKGILELLSFYQIDVQGKHCVVVGRSHIVGTPISILLTRNDKIGNCTVTLTHSHTQNLETHTRMADLLIVAIGKPNFITADMIKPGAVVIDVGLTRIADERKKSGYSLVGDVDFEGAKKICSAITPVPFGVGPMTIYSLLHNTFLAYEKAQDDLTEKGALEEPSVFF